MAWNPSPQVAAVRDAAKKLESPFAVVVYLTKDNRVAMASYGANQNLCTMAGKFGEHLLLAALKWGAKEPTSTHSTPMT